MNEIKFLHEASASETSLCLTVLKYILSERCGEGTSLLARVHSSKSERFHNFYYSLVYDKSNSGTLLLISQAYEFFTWSSSLFTT